MSAARQSARRLALAAIVLSAACGGDGPAAPSPDGSRPPTPVVVMTPGGVISGKYVLRIEPARECASPSSVLSFRVDARPDDSGRRPGVQVALEFNPYLEMEFQYATPTLLGSLATDPYERIAATEAPGVAVWFWGVATGSVASEGGGPGQVQQGTFVGDVAFNDTARTCFSTGHRWSLKLQ